MKGQGVKSCKIKYHNEFYWFCWYKILILWFSKLNIWSASLMSNKMIFTAFRVTLLILEMLSVLSTFISSLSRVPSVTLSMWQCRAADDGAALSFWLEHETNELLPRSYRETILEFHLWSVRQSTILEATRTLSSIEQHDHIQLTHHHLSFSSKHSQHLRYQVRVHLVQEIDKNVSQQLEDNPTARTRFRMDSQKLVELLPVASVDVQFQTCTKESRRLKRFLIFFHRSNRKWKRFSTRSIGFPMQFSNSDMNMMNLPAWFMSLAGSCGIASPEESWSNDRWQ